MKNFYKQELFFQKEDLQIPSLLIKKYQYNLLLGDGIFDKLSSSEVIKASWDSIRTEQNNTSTENTQQLNTHNICAKGVEGVIQEALNSRSTDNLTGLLISFIDFQNQARPVLSVDNQNHLKSEVNCQTINKNQEIGSIPKQSEKKENQYIQLEEIPQFYHNRKLSLSDRAIIGESQSDDRHDSITPQSINSQAPQQRRFSLQFQTNNEQETSYLRQQIKAFNSKTVYDTNQHNLLKSFHFPVIVKKELSSIGNNTNKTSQIENDKNQSKVNCIQKKVNDLKK